MNSTPFAGPIVPVCEILLVDFETKPGNIKKKYLFNILSNAKFYLVFILNVGMYLQIFV